MAKHLIAGLAAHVDAGKTTLSESMLFLSGAVRKQGRVDHGDAFLDTEQMEKERGITIFSKEARLTWNKVSVTLMDTPGHTDFAGETERALSVLDLAVLVVSAAEGIQSHTRTLWKLLARGGIPVSGEVAESTSWTHSAARPKKDWARRETGSFPGKDSS